MLFLTLKFDIFNITLVLTLINSILISNQILNASIREVNDDAEAQIEVEIAEDIMMKEMQGYRIYHVVYSEVYIL